MLATNSKSTKYRNHNAGFSIIELLVVVAIMAVLTGVGIATYSSVSNANVKKTATQVNNLMNECRQKAKAKATTSWAIRMDYSEKGSPVCAIYQGDSLTAYSSETLAGIVDLKICYPDTDAEGAASVTTIEVGPDAEAQYVGVAYVKLSGKVGSISVGTSENVETILPERDYYDLVFTRKSQVYTIRLYRTTGKQEMTQGSF